MIETFLLSWRLKNTYQVNGILFGLKSLPLIKKLLPASLYASTGLKTFATVISLVWELLTTFLWRGLLVTLAMLLPANSMATESGPAAAQFLLGLILIGGFLNTNLFDPTRDKYYAIFLLRMDARRYTLSNYAYFLCKNIIGFLPWTLAMTAWVGWPLWLGLTAPLLPVTSKLCCAALALVRQRKKLDAPNENKFTFHKVLLAAALLAAAYLPPWLLQWTLPYGAVAGIFLVVLAAAIPSLLYLLRFPYFRQVYKRLLTPENLYIGKEARAQASQGAYLKKLDDTVPAQSTRHGYAYFNDLFIQRHRKLLTRSARRITWLALAGVAAAVLACFFFPAWKEAANEISLTMLPYFLFLMYFLNRGRVVTQAMFMNCDHGMLSYRFYRQPRAILRLFTLRLRALIAINLPPALVIAVGLPLLLWVSGGTNQPVNYLLLFISILAMSIFFSVHYLVMYYLLQPYNADLEMKNPAFSIVSTLTYLACYILMQQKFPTMVFGTLLSLFCLVYVAVALLLVYRLAPHTFRLRH